MKDHERESDVQEKPTRVNPGYAALQIAKALTTSREHLDPATRERANQKISKWETVLQNILSGAVDYGSRTPVEAPGWVTLEVVTGGFATGELLAAGPLQSHEKTLLKNLPEAPEGKERATLNGYFLTEEGLADLQEKLRTNSYDVGVPEEGALLVVAWLVENRYTNEALALLDELSPFISELRFYPNPLDQPRRFGSRVHLQDVATTITDLKNIRPNKRILAQKEAIEVWAPYYDRVVALFLETVVNNWPCKHYPQGWPERALALHNEFAALRSAHMLCGKPERANGHFAQLRAFLNRCTRNPESLTGREVGRIRLILKRYLEKRGAPNSPTCIEERSRQATYVSGSTFHEIAGVVIPRLEKHAKADGLDDISDLTQPINKEEADNFGITEASVPLSIQRKVERCLNETIQVLVERNLITSGETLARLLPQMISGLRAAGIGDPALRHLYAAIYRAFRRRRSLLLLNLEKQIQVEELPWVAAIDRFRNEQLSESELARQTLEEITLLTLSSFPYAILPNKLIQELRALAKGAKLDIPLVEEVAVDIFMGEFTGKFLESAKRAAQLLRGTLYATYYGIDYEDISTMPEAKQKGKPIWFWRRLEPATDRFGQLCASRAGVPTGTWNAVTNGMIIEQQQILTTQNLAALFSGLGLTETLHPQLQEMARQCFTWVCRRQQMKIALWHSRLIMLKNTAYAWRQMIFFLSLLPKDRVADFLRWAESHFEAQSEEFRKRFRPALQGLVLAAEGNSIINESGLPSGARQFLGWSKSKHWLLNDTDPSLNKSAR